MRQTTHKLIAVLFLCLTCLAEAVAQYDVRCWRMPERHRIKLCSLSPSGRRVMYATETIAWFSREVFRDGKQLFSAMHRAVGVAIGDKGMCVAVVGVGDRLYFFEESLLLGSTRAGDVLGPVISRTGLKWYVGVNHPPTASKSTAPAHPNPGSSTIFSRRGPAVISEGHLHHLALVDENLSALSVISGTNPDGTPIQHLRSHNVSMVTAKSFPSLVAREGFGFAAIEDQGGFVGLASNLFKNIEQFRQVSSVRVQRPGGEACVVSCVQTDDGQWWVRKNRSREFVHRSKIYDAVCLWNGSLAFVAEEAKERREIFIDGISNDVWDSAEIRQAPYSAPAIVCRRGSAFWILLDTKRLLGPFENVNHIHVSESGNVWFSERTSAGERLFMGSRSLLNANRVWSIRGAWSTPSVAFSLGSWLFHIDLRQKYRLRAKAWR